LSCLNEGWRIKLNILTEKQRTQKAGRIADTALALFKTQSFGSISMSQIATQSGVSKGTLFNYFETKENIFMFLLLNGYQNYFKKLIKKLQQLPPELSNEVFCEFMIAQTRYLIRDQSVLVRLNALRAPVLEGRANIQQTLAGRKRLYEISQRLGEVIAERITLISASEASHLFVVQSAIISGLMNMMGLDEFNHKKLTSNFKDFRVNLETDAVQAFKFYLDGFLASKTGK
jgi:AcrR family transcriptional regulator